MYGYDDTGLRLGGGWAERCAISLTECVAVLRNPGFILSSHAVILILIVYRLLIVESLFTAQGWVFSCFVPQSQQDFSLKLNGKKTPNIKSGIGRVRIMTGQVVKSLWCLF